MSTARLNAVTVYCSSSNAVHREFFDGASAVGIGLAASGRTLVYGGGKVGLMGELARSCRGAGGRVVGIITTALKEAEQLDPDNHETIVVETMRERKRLLESRGDAVVVLPGGLGTMEEFFEILVGRLLGEHNKPILVLNQHDPGSSNGSGFYDPMLRMIDHMIEAKFAKAGVKGLFTVCDTAAAVLAELRRLESVPSVVVDRMSLVPSAPV
ncbi:MAG: TIGR00730 family Rossman fold protein [Phycisphaerales bacterium]